MAPIHVTDFQLTSRTFCLESHQTSTVSDAASVVEHSVFCVSVKTIYVEENIIVVDIETGYAL